MKVLIVTSCTGKKLYNPSNKLIKGDFIIDYHTKEKELLDYKTKAIDMYTGSQHLNLVEGLNVLRAFRNDLNVDLKILSAGYGLINENDLIVPYEVTFNDMSKREFADWIKYLDINNSISNAIKEYDLVFFLLGGKYLQALSLPLKVIKPNQKLIFLASENNLLKKPPYYLIPIIQEDAKSFSYGLVGLKGYLMKILLQELALQGEDLLDKIYQDPFIIKSILDNFRIS